MLEQASWNVDAANLGESTSCRAFGRDGTNVVLVMLAALSEAVPAVWQITASGGVVVGAGPLLVHGFQPDDALRGFLLSTYFGVTVLWDS
jgi:hypothetical protein